MPRVTVVTAAYNAAPYIAETIESVLSQSYFDFEYIVVDDGSTDDTAAILAGYGDRLTVVRQENGGEGAARNRGFELASGEYVAVVDADDTWAPDKLEQQVRAMDASPDSGLCYTNSTTIRSDGSVVAVSRVPQRLRLDFVATMRSQGPIVNSSVMYRRRLLEPRPYRDLPVAADYYVHLKALWRSGQPAVLLDDALVNYRLVETSVLRRSDPWSRGRWTLVALQTFFDDMRVEKPIPGDVVRRGLAYAHLRWAWYCIDGRTRYRFALSELCRAVRMDVTLLPMAAKQFAKLGRNLVQRAP